MDHELRKAVLLVGGLAVALVLVAMASRAPVEPAAAAAPAAAAPAPVPTPVVDQVEPLSEDCQGLVKTAERNGLIRPGSIDRSGAMILTDARWAGLPADMQDALAVCVSHYIAGGQNRWIKRLVFRNQVSGVTYGVIENTRYRIGE